MNSPVGNFTDARPATERLDLLAASGLALAVTGALLAAALSRGVRTVFLAAGDADVARPYARLGFRPRRYRAGRGA